MGVDASRCGEVMGSSAFREDTECGRLGPFMSLLSGLGA